TLVLPVFFTAGVGLLNLFWSRIGLQSESNLSRWDFIRLWWELRKIGSHRINFIDLGLNRAIKQALLPDETLILEIEPDAIDRLIIKYFSQPNIKQESLALGIYNATGRSGLANRVTRLVGNLGGRVVEVGDWEEELQECQIIASDQWQESVVLIKLGRVYGCSFSLTTNQPKANDAAIVIGQDYWQKLNQNY
ncbi:LytR C-terminal domain-containing protein, partial [Patescibacteria group bacterium]